MQTIQSSYQPTHISEDCLYLNVFVPMNLSEKVTTPKSAMVFVHGGSFVEGSGITYDGGLVVRVCFYTRLHR